MSQDPVMIARSIRSLLNIIERLGNRVLINTGPTYIEYRAISVSDPQKQVIARTEGPATPERDHHAARRLAEQLGVDEEVLLLHQ